MGSIWGRQDPGGPNFGPVNFAIWVDMRETCYLIKIRIKLNLPIEKQLLLRKIMFDFVLFRNMAVNSARLWPRQMETLPTLRAFWTGNSLVTGEFPAQRLVTRRFDAFFDLHLIKRLSKQSWGWRFETPSRPLWRPSDEIFLNVAIAYCNRIHNLYDPAFMDMKKASASLLDKNAYIVYNFQHNENNMKLCYKNELMIF